MAVGDEYDAVLRTDTSAIITSPNGIDWTIRHSRASQSMMDVTFGDGKFVAVGTNETRDKLGNWSDETAVVLTSSDGVTWTATELGKDIPWLQTVTFSRLYAKFKGGNGCHHVGTPPLAAGVGGFFTIRRQR